MKRVLLSWSSGKDSAWALNILRATDGIEVVGLLTTLNSQFDRVAMHGTRRTVLEAQAQAAGLPLWTVPLPWPCSNEDYERRMLATCERAKQEGVHAIAFGDLFLADIRAYRETQLQPTGLEPLFPLWNLPTRQLARDMIAAGLRAKLTCVDAKQLDPSFAGRDFDLEFLRQLPPEVDPCGERGEFHTCVYQGRCSMRRSNCKQARSCPAMVSPTPISSDYEFRLFADGQFHPRLDDPSLPISSQVIRNK